FSSRRRHTRFSRDWSSDVCSSDLIPAEKRPVNTVFQSYALFPHMTVFDNVAFGLKMSRVAKSEIKTRVMEALEMVRLGDYAQRRSEERRVGKGVEGGACRQRKTIV